MEIKENVEWSRCWRAKPRANNTKPSSRSCGPTRFLNRVLSNAFYAAMLTLSRVYTMLRRTTCGKEKVVHDICPEQRSKINQSNLNIRYRIYKNCTVLLTGDTNQYNDRKYPLISSVSGYEICSYKNNKYATTNTLCK